MMVARHTHIVQRYLLLPVTICHSNQIEVKYSHLPELAPRTKAEVKPDLHVEPSHHMQKLDKTHCKAFLRSDYAVQMSKVGRRTSIGLHDLWIMVVGHDRRGKSRHEARGGRGTLGMVGRTTRRGILRALILKGT